MAFVFQKVIGCDNGKTEMQYVHGMLVDLRGELFAHIRLEGIIAIKEERVFAGSVFYARHASAVCAHIRVVGDYSDACVLCSRLCCDLSDIIWARIVYDNRFYIREGLIPY